MTSFIKTFDSGMGLNSARNVREYCVAACISGKFIMIMFCVEHALHASTRQKQQRCTRCNTKSSRHYAPDLKYSHDPR